jgi:LytS/YehU family sensor histidine kinase
LRSLKSQLNPHFLFNSLNSVRALIVDDPQLAQTAITQLARMLRYTLGGGLPETASSCVMASAAGSYR